MFFAAIMGLFFAGYYSMINHTNSFNHIYSVNHILIINRLRRVKLPDEGRKEQKLWNFQKENMRGW